MFRYEKEMKFSDCKWNDVYENILVHKSDKSRYMAMLCHYTSTYYNRQRKILLVPASIISWSLNIFGMVSTYFGKEKISEPLVILIVSLGNFIIATLTTIAENNKAGDKVELFNQTSRDYNLIASEIKQELMLPPDNRASVMKIIIETQRRYDDLMKSTPNIPEHVIISFINKHKRDQEFLYMVQPENIINMTSCRNYVYKKPKNDIIKTINKNDFFLSTLKKPNNDDDINNDIRNDNDIQNCNLENSMVSTNSNNTDETIKTINTNCSLVEIKELTDNLNNSDDNENDNCNDSGSNSTIDLTQINCNNIDNII